MKFLISSIRIRKKKPDTPYDDNYVILLMSCRQVIQKWRLQERPEFRNINVIHVWRRFLFFGSLFYCAFSVTRLYIALMRG
jgi:hypothetical protein